MEYSSTQSSKKSDDFQDIGENINHITCKVINCRMSNFQIELLDKVNSSDKSQNEKNSNIIKLNEHPHLVHQMPDVLSSDESFNMSGKMVALEELLIKKKRIIILSKIGLVLGIIKNYFEDKKYKCLVLNGYIRGEKRQEAINAFNSADFDVCIFLIEFNDIFKGINLRCTDTLIFYDNEINEQREAEIIQNFNIRNDAIFYHLIISNECQIDKYEINFPKTEKVDLVDSESKDQNAYSEPVKNENLSEEDLIFKTDQILQSEPNFPLKINNVLTILNIGKIIKRKSFHTEKYIYPLGYSAKRLEASVKNPKEMVWYLLKINEDIHHNPVFRIEMENDESVFFEDSEPTKACMKLYKSIGNKILLSGPEFFGLSFYVVRHIIQNIASEKLCLKFQIGGACQPTKHYMVKLDDRMKHIKENYIEKEEYFGINKSRQTGKTTTLFALANYLKSEYYIFLVDLQKIEEQFFKSNEVFLNEFIYHFLQSYKIFNDNPDPELIKPIEQLLDKPNLNFTYFLRMINSICEISPKPLVLIIDEIDKFKIKPKILIEFLSLLRGEYQMLDKIPSFHSLILSGVRNVQYLRAQISDKDEFNGSYSPWNIDTIFIYEMSFSISEIASMLEEYESVNHTGMQIEDISRCIYDYTSGHPFLVSAICKMIDEKISNDSDCEKWSRQGVNKSVDIILNSHLAFITDILLKLDNNPDLKQMLKAIILEGQTFLTGDTHDDSIEEGIMFGIIKIENGNISIANRVTQMLLSYRFISEEKVKLFHITESFDRSKYINSGKLNMECILNGFIDHFKNYYNSKNTFLEEYGRFVFMTFLRPIINGNGHFYMEPQIKDGKRVDLIIDFFKDQYLIEFKIFHGQNYIDKGIKQLVDYLNINNLNTGYLIIYNFNQNKETGIKKIELENKTIIQATI